jgi:hypothetical protein
MPTYGRNRQSGAAGVTNSTIPAQGIGPGLSPRAALQSIEVKPVPFAVARAIVEQHHYLHSLPGGTKLVFGSFVGDSLLGAVTLGVGPFNAPSLVGGASGSDCLTLTRLWLSDELPRNSESKVIGVVMRSLRKHTSIRFVLSYADPSQGHLGTIYQATNWLYTGVSEPTPLYDLGDGHARHSRSFAHAYGSRSVRHFASHGVDVKLVPQQGKHRYVYFVDPSWQPRLLVPVLPYPRKESQVDGDH